MVKFANPFIFLMNLVFTTLCLPGCSVLPETGAQPRTALTYHELMDGFAASSPIGEAALTPPGEDS